METQVIVLIIVGSIINWIILYLVIEAATRRKANMIYVKAQFDLLKQIALKNGVDQDIVMEIDNRKNKSIMEWQDQEQIKTFQKKLQSQPIYFVNSMENAYIRSEPGNGFWIKFHGEPEYKAKEGSTIVTEGILEHKEIKKKRYDSGK
jgi:hypothetical protein